MTVGVDELLARPVLFVELVDLLGDGDESIDAAEMIRRLRSEQDG